MPTKREREYYAMGFRDAINLTGMDEDDVKHALFLQKEYDRPRFDVSQTRRRSTTRPKRKLSAWNKFVKANAKKPRFRYRNGKLNLKKMAVAFRKTPAGKKKRR